MPASNGRSESGPVKPRKATPSCATGGVNRERIGRRATGCGSIGAVTVTWPMMASTWSLPASVRASVPALFACGRATLTPIRYAPGGRPAGTTRPTCSVTSAPGSRSAQAAAYSRLLQTWPCSSSSRRLTLRLAGSDRRQVSSSASGSLAAATVAGVVAAATSCTAPKSAFVATGVGAGRSAQAVRRVAAYQRFSRLALRCARYCSISPGNELPKLSGSGNQIAPRWRDASSVVCTAGDHATAALAAVSSSGVGPESAGSACGV